MLELEAGAEVVDKGRQLVVAGVDAEARVEAPLEDGRDLDGDIDVLGPSTEPGRCTSNRLLCPKEGMEEGKRRAPLRTSGPLSVCRCFTGKHPTSQSPQNKRTFPPPFLSLAVLSTWAQAGARAKRSDHKRVILPMRFPAQNMAVGSRPQEFAHPRGCLDGKSPSEEDVATCNWGGVSCML